MEPFKNHLDSRKATSIGEAIAAHEPAFQLRSFRRNLAAELEPLELKERVDYIAGKIIAASPHPAHGTLRMLAEMAAPDAACGLSGFQIWPLTKVVSMIGLPHHRASMAALEHLTQLFTAEWDIRPFITAAHEQTFKQLHAWCEHPSEHVRRLVSEGTRPLLPWGSRLPEMASPPFPSLALLEKLHADPSPYVRLSVSNHLNDLSKTQPDLVLRILRSWLDAAPQDQAQAKLARHALRTLIKRGHREALAIIGFPKSKLIALDGFRLSTDKVPIGGVLEISMTIKNGSRQTQGAMFDYGIHYRRANGQLGPPKIYKGRSKSLRAGETWRVEASHSFRIITTRQYHPGVHILEFFVNGTSCGSREFSLG